MIHVGMGGWDLKPYEDFFYPPRKGKGFRKLEFYSRYFDFVEINSTFYNTYLLPHHALRWISDVSDNPSFLFTVKLYRGFTHTFSANRADLLSTHRLLDTLRAAGKLHGLVIQFPYSFTNILERREYLSRLARAFRPYTLFLDLRHNSWDPEKMKPYFTDLQLHVINIDLPRIKRHVPFRAMTWDGLTYFRLMGRNSTTWDHPERGDRYSYLYSEQELQELISAIERCRANSHSLYVVFHNDPDAHSLINGFQLRNLLHAPLRTPPSRLTNRPSFLTPQSLIGLPLPSDPPPALSLCG